MNGRLWLVAIAALGCQRPSPPPPPVPVPTVPPTAAAVVAPAGLTVPQARRAPALDQHDDDAIWQQSAATGPWMNPQTHERARPYSNARLLWDADNLYLSLYAADQNIQAGHAQHDQPLTTLDAFAVRLQADRANAREFALEIAATGTLTDGEWRNGQLDPAWESGARVSMDMDGTLNNPEGEDDEEWVAFVALPWKSLGIAPGVGVRLRLQMQRCDVPKDGIKRCGAFAQTVALALAR